ncbi:hypothetical protein [Pectobacterium brasiliense]|uniref:hypothetical protein n=1 Tax=Pectobacterium brasiliense TaxID=180957 RepID=UPI001968D4E9|nr:hypothetical protein [Pectobacterium brasiliense]MBN3262245.1 hypothetical protein [Pectobacterium brasiliense]
MTNPEFSRLSLIRRFAKRITYWLLCGGLIATIPPVGYTSQSNTAGQAQGFKTCSQRLTAGDNRYLGKVIQTQLTSLYQYNSDFQAQMKKDSKLLTDGIVGPVTRYWLDYFCSEFSFTAPESSNNRHSVFIESLLIDLGRATQLNALFPQWRTVIKPSELLHLTSAEIVQKLADTSTPVLPPDPEISSSNTEPYYYQLTEKDFASLALRQTVLETLEKLEKQQFDQRSQLYNQLSELFTQLNIPTAQSINIDNLIDSYTIEPPQPSTSATTSTSTSTSQIMDGEAKGIDTENQHTADNNIDNSNVDNNHADNNSPPNTSKQVVETSTQSNTQTTAPQLIWQLNPEELKNTLTELPISALSKDELKTLAPLRDEVFPSLYLLQVAVNASGISPASSQGKSIVELAKKSGQSPTYAVPMQWEAPPDCACQDSVRSIFNVGTFYGFYPYWQHLDKGQTIDFSRLDRIGYIGAVMKPEGNSNTLALPQNWSAKPTFSQFIQTTHRYRTKFDLVVTTPRDLSREQLTALFTDDMVKRLVESVTTPMDEYVINTVQPWISFGLETVPTMADGITLDIDLSVLDTPGSQQALFFFLNKLKIALRQSYQHQPIVSELDYPLTNSDRYYLNIIVPAKDVVAPKNGFYNFINLDALSQRTHLIIVRPGSPDASDEAKVELDRIKDLQKWLSSQENQSAVQQVYKQLVPMLITEDNRSQTQDLTQLVNLSSWSFLGAAYWPLPLSEANEKLINKTFFPESPQYPKPINQVINSINSLLNWVCIYRMELRAGLFVSFMFILVFLAICIWSFPLRKHLSRFPFVALTSLSISGLMLVFVADPTFQDYQGPIMLTFIVVIGWILFAVRMVRKEGDKP